MRIQVILTTFVIVANLIGIGVATLVVTVAFPTPSVFEPTVAWITFIVVPVYMVRGADRRASSGRPAG